MRGHFLDASLTRFYLGFRRLLRTQDLDLSLKLWQGILDLTKSLIGGNRHAGRQVQTTGAFANHRYGHRLGGMEKQKVGIQPLGFLAKYEPVSGLILRLKVGALSFSGEEPHSGGVPHQTHPILKGLMATPSQVRPVIQPRPLQIGVIDFKAHFSYNVQLTVRAHAGAADISSVLGNLGLDKNNAEKFLRIRQDA